MDLVSKLLEVDILMQADQLEVCFDPSAAYVWAFTLQDMLFASPPQIVKISAQKTAEEHAAMNWMMKQKRWLLLQAAIIL